MSIFSRSEKTLRAALFIFGLNADHLYIYDFEINYFLEAIRSSKYQEYFDKNKNHTFNNKKLLDIPLTVSTQLQNTF